MMNTTIPTVCIAILNYNGIHFLEELIPSLRTATRKWEGMCSIVLLDNQSSEPDCEWVKNNYPEVEVVVAPANDMLYSYNWLIPTRREKIIILLNNDIRVDEGFIAPLIKHFDHKDVFAVGATSKDWEGESYTCGPWFFRINQGLYYWDYDASRQQVGHTLLTVGGFMAVSWEKFIELGGFNRLFYPAYCEETELCFRAWRRGWRCVFEPESLVYHYDGGSFKKQSKRQRKIQLRSYFLFQWACLPDIKPKWWSEVLVLARCTKYLFQGKLYWPMTYIRTRMEWRKKYIQHSDMKTPLNEFVKINERVSSPVISN